MNNQHIVAVPASALSDGWATQLEAVLTAGLGLRAGQSLVVVWDGLTPRQLVDDIADVASGIAGEVVVAAYRPRVSLPLSRYCYFTQAAMAPTLQLPASVIGAMREADAIVLALSDLEVLFSSEVREISGQGHQIIMLPYTDRAAARRLLPRSIAEVQALAGLTDAVGAIVRAAHTAHVRTPAGTDLTLEFGSDSTCVYGGRASAREIQILPGGQVSRMPAERTAQGVVVVDRTIAHGDYKALTESIRLTVHNGYVTDIDGGREADYLRGFLASLDDPEVYHLTELGVGLNPRCDKIGVNAPAEDTHAIGTASFALGCDSHLGGEVRAPVHIDMTMRAPTVAVDDLRLMVDGRISDELRARRPEVAVLEQAYADDRD